ncbi:unnamed protein product [Kuraishia capsulata CBS 1993]|uniref:Carboxymuconolactone decarboxylase-like domain-containing protein n=1 Tax=Kuraishia capsulata CBS 1993 TaxID=1382522 RepID=W6MMR7_9ASCO|nr:uncharacterized protein KUCA_T00002243001 [Kuraishia capsulata CBS 1993]CDK26272.1 unnamed protein product [Kuraishia capsulata CBS 1993]
MAEDKQTEHFRSLEALITKSDESALVENPWYMLVALVYTVKRKYADLVALSKYVLYRDPSLSVDEKRRILRRIREALYKNGVLYGNPVMINAMLELRKGLDAELFEDTAYRDHKKPLEDLETNGYDVFKRTYGDTTDEVVGLLKNVHPDYPYSALTLIFGPVLGFYDILNPAETSLTMVAALIAFDLPLQAKWHLNGAYRNGATKEEVLSARALIIEVLGANDADIPSLDIA